MKGDCMKRFYDLPAGLSVERVKSSDDDYHSGSAGGIFDLGRVQYVENIREDRHRVYFEINMGSDVMYYSTVIKGCTKQVADTRRTQALLIRESVINAWIAYNIGNDMNIAEAIVTQF